MLSIRIAAATAAMGALALATSTAEACPIGVQGIADPGSTVCAQDLSTGELYCDFADAAGNFYIIGGEEPPSTTGACLPTLGTFYFYEIGCENEGMTVDRYDPSQEFGGRWLDLRCQPDCGAGKCENGSYTDGCVSYAPSSPVSILMCQCDLLDPACGVGTCNPNGAYSTGMNCATPISYLPSSLVSQVMCGGDPIDPKTCTSPECKPYSIDRSVGTCDKYDASNGAETSSPSADLLTYISNVYSIPGSRDLDDPGANQWFGHTFTGLAPQNGARICGARLTGNLGASTSLNSNNDSLGLLFVDASGNPVGQSYYEYLSAFGITGGSSASISIDIGSLPNGAALLAQMENGWLDFIVQDDSGVDCLDLQVDYCCPCEPYSTQATAGVCDAFNGTSEAAGPSADLLTYIASVYSVSGSRDFDETGANQWFGHTFTNLKPKNGSHICGAELTATIGEGTFPTNNDSFGLLFVDASGNPVGTSHYAYLSGYGILNGSSATITLDIGALGGPAMLAQMENGWLDFIVQDDTAVDCLDLKIEYCCSHDPTEEPSPPVD